jgi:hypothetical protein
MYNYQFSIPPDPPVCAARIAEGKKEDSYVALDKTSHDSLPLAFNVFCGTAPRADEFLRRLASIVVTRRAGYSEGPNFSPNYVILLHKWRTRISLTINREIANAIFEGGARNARGGERQFAVGRGLAESNLHLFEAVQLLL